MAATAVLVLALASSARAETFYASPAGNDDTDPVVCTDPAAPCSLRDARGASDEAAGVDTVVLASGTYDLITIRCCCRASAATVRSWPRRSSSSARAASGAAAIELNRPSALPDTDGDLVLRHVTAVSGGAALNAYTFGGTVVSASVSDSILAGTITPGGATVLYDHSASTSGALPGTGNLQATLDAVFPNLAIGGVRPGAGSPTIDAGGAAGDWDLARSARGPTWARWSGFRRRRWRSPAT